MNIVSLYGNGHPIYNRQASFHRIFLNIIHKSQQWFNVQKNTVELGVQRKKAGQGNGPAPYIWEEENNFRVSGTSVKDWLPVFCLRGFKAHSDLFTVAFSFRQMFRQLIQAKELTGNCFQVWLEISGDIPAQDEG